MTTVAIIITLAGSTAAQDDYSQTTVNTCITPRACFTNNDTPGIDYCITTPWHITYPQHLRSQLQDPTKNPDLTTLTNVYNCGWSYGYDVSRTSVYRGTIYYRSPNNGSFDYPPTLWTDTTGAFNALHDIYPGVEIALILLFTVGIPFVIVFVMVAAACLAGFAKCLSRGKAAHRERMRQRAVRAEERRERKEREKQQKRESEDTTAWNGTEKMPPDTASGSMV